MKRLAFAFFVFSGCVSTALYPARPAASTSALVADPLPAKLIIHVDATAEGLRHALDTSLPTEGETKFTFSGERTVKWSRSGFSLRFADGRVEVKTALALQVDLPMLRGATIPLDVSVVGEPIITSDWKARLQGAKVKLESKDFRLRTLQGLGGALEAAQKLTEEFIEGYSYDLSPKLNETYQRIAAPITFPVGDANACAVLKVISIEAGPSVFAGGLEKDLAFVVEPSVTLPCNDEKVASAPPPLSNVATLPSGPFSVTVPIAAKYEELARAMSATFTDGKLFFSKSYPQLFFSKPEVYASKRDELVLKLRLEGPIQVGNATLNLDGDLYFAGHPQVVDNELRIPDLEPTVDTKNFLLGLKATLDRDGIRDQAREALKLDLGARFAAVREKLSNDVAFGGDLGCLRAHVAKIEVTGVFPHASYLRVYVTTTAQAAVHLPCPSQDVAAAR